MRSFLLVSTSAAFLFLSACGQTSNRSLRDMSQLQLAKRKGVEDYQIGPEWGKKIVKKDSLDSQTKVFQKLAKGTAKIGFGFGGATGFAIGEKDGDVVLATNHHVIGGTKDCKSANISFEMLGISRLKCDKILVTSTDLDLTIFTISGASADAKAKILEVAMPFDTAPSKKGTQLLTIGYGIAGGNDSQKNMMAGQDSDCKTFSPDGEMRFMADPDELNPGPHKTWMFATGCDVSHGDSGSALVERRTGKIVGILSTGKIPKSPKVRDADYLKQIFDEASEDVWKELTFAVPSDKIIEVVGSYLP